jgi:streptogramin lyase
MTAKNLAVMALLALAGRYAAMGAGLVNVAGTGEAGWAGDGGPALQAKLNNPYGLVRGPDRALWFADYEAHVIRRIAPDGSITTVVGVGRPGYAGDGGPAVAASLNNPHELRFDSAGSLFIADTGNNVVRRYELKTKILTTFAGVGKQGYSGDGGPADRAQFNSPISIQWSPSGDLYVADIGNHVIRRIDGKTRIITTFAGTGKSGPTPDGAPIAGTPLNGPRSLDFDSAGNLWLVTREGNQVLRLDLASGVIHHMAGTGKKGFTGDGGQAHDATFNGPKGISVAPNGDVYLADTENHAIRRLDAKRGTVERVVGIGQPGDNGEGDPLKASLTRPHGVFVDKDGTLYIGDSENHRIRSLKQ